MTIPSPRSRAHALWFILPAVLVAVADATITLYLQTSTYWLGLFSTAAENNPLGAFFLRLHPLAFIGFMFIWVSLIVALGLCLRQPWSTVAGLTVLLGHTAGIFGTLKRFGFVAALSTFLLVALITTFCWRRAGTCAQT